MFVLQINEIPEFKYKTQYKIVNYLLNIARSYGKINELIIALVIYTDRNGNFRIISARKANKKEKRQYYGN